MEDYDDFELIKMYINGNHRAFEVLYGRYRTRLYAFLYRLLSSNRSEVDDIFQIVWMRAIDKMPHLRANGSFYGYLQQTARNLIIDRVRKQKRHGVHIAIDDEDSVPIADENACEPYFELYNVEDHELMEKAAASLSDEQQKVWKFRMQGISFKEIAELENCSLNTALARMSYAKKNIKIFLEKHS